MTDLKTWAKAAVIRAVKTMFQTALAMIGATVFIHEVNWMAVVSAAVLSASLSLMTSLAGLPEEKKEAEIKTLKNGGTED